MRTVMKPATSRNGIIIALILGGFLTACQPEEVSPQSKDQLKNQLVKSRTKDAPPGGNNGGGGGN